MSVNEIPPKGIELYTKFMDSYFNPNMIKHMRTLEFKNFGEFAWYLQVNRVLIDTFDEYRDTIPDDTRSSSKLNYIRTIGRKEWWTQDPNSNLYKLLGKMNVGTYVSNAVAASNTQPVMNQSGVIMYSNPQQSNPRSSQQQYSNQQQQQQQPIQIASQLNPRSSQRQHLPFFPRQNGNPIPTAHTEPIRNPKITILDPLHVEQKEEKENKTPPATPQPEQETKVDEIKYNVKPYTKYFGALKLKEVPDIVRANFIKDAAVIKDLANRNIPIETAFDQLQAAAAQAVTNGHYSIIKLGEKLEPQIEENERATFRRRYKEMADLIKNKKTKTKKAYKTAGELAAFLEKIIRSPDSSQKDVAEELFDLYSQSFTYRDE